MERHTESLHAHYVVWLDNLAWRVLYPFLGTVQVGDCHVDAGEGFEQRDLLIYGKIGTLSFKKFVFFYFYDGYYISWLDVGNAVTFPMHRKLLTVRRPLIDLHVERLGLTHNLLTLTGLASLRHVNNFTRTPAFVTWTGALAVHTGAHLSHYSSHTSSLAGFARYHGGRIGSTDTIAREANPLSFDFEIEGVTVVHICQAAFNFTCNRFYSNFSFLCAGMTTTSEHGEDVVHAAGATAAHTFLDSIHTMLIVNVSLIFVEENLVSASHFFELYEEVIG